MPELMTSWCRRYYTSLCINDGANAAFYWAGACGRFIQSVHQMSGQIQERVYHIQTRNKKKQGKRSYKQRLERTDVLYRVSVKCLDKLKRWLTTSTRYKVPTNTGRNVRICFIQGLQNISGQIQQFSTSKQNKNCIQTQSENEWFLS